MAKLILITTVDHSLHHLLDNNSLTAANIWATLKSNYSAITTLASFVKFWAYFPHAIDDSKPLAQSLEEHNRLWKEVDNSDIMKDTKLLKIFGLLTSLLFMYSNIVEPILAVTKPTDLDYNMICSRLLDDAMRKEGGDNMSAVRFNGKGSGRKATKDDACNFCDIKEHFEYDCHKKKKISEELKAKAKVKAKARARVKVVEEMDNLCPRPLVTCFLVPCPHLYTL